jgi:very-short-patch-repair endonuclease
MRNINKSFVNLSRNLRKNETPWEIKLWQRLRGRKFLGFKFKKQLVIGNYIYDFGCFEKRLLIELDGGQHSENDIKDKDQIKEDFAKNQGYKIIRFWNNELDNNFEGVLETIRKNLL